MGNGNGSAVGFRTLQSIHDLRHVAASASPSTRQRIAAGVSKTALLPGSALDALDRLIESDGCRFVPRETLGLHTSLVLTATLPQDDGEAFLAATAILLADRLQNGAGEDDLYWHWDAFQENYLAAPATARAAIMQGFARAELDGRISLGTEIDTDWRTTRRARALTPILHVLSLAASEEDVDAVAKAGAGTGGAAVAEVTETLDRAIRSDDGLLDPHSDPSVDRCLAAASADPTNSGFAMASALRLIRGFEDEASAIDLARHWALLAPEYKALPPHEAHPLLAGFRHLYERYARWSPHPGELFPTDAGSPAIIPVVPVDA